MPYNSWGGLGYSYMVAWFGSATGKYYFYFNLCIKRLTFLIWNLWPDTVDCFKIEKMIRLSLEHVKMNTYQLLSRYTSRQNDYSPTHHAVVLRSHNFWFLSSTCIYKLYSYGDLRLTVFKFKLSSIWQPFVYDTCIHITHSIPNVFINYTNC